MDFNISGYLKKFAGFLPHEVRVKNAVGSAIQEVLGITLERSKMAVSGSKVFISGSSALRSEIALKQGKILERVKEKEPGLIIDKVQ